ncbi:hypothetical protein BJX63DRAFT_432916 [Aspergillus granulosus]|uniref:Uncharacterized protein n=1 Tax=Aspergillus granulosus TaxID=176169 RepID=A0ABR4H9F8_9EURO
MSSTKKENSTLEDIPAGDSRFCFECLRNIDSDGKVDLIGVAAALNYSNIASAGNRFRALSHRYGFGNLKCKNAGSPVKAKAASTSTAADSAPAKADPSTPTKGAAGKPAKNPSTRKGAKKSSTEPIPATKGKNQGKDSGSEEIEEEKEEAEKGDVAVVVLRVPSN